MLSSPSKTHLISALHSVASFMLFELAGQIYLHQEAITSLQVDHALLSGIAFAVIRAGVKAATPLAIKNLKYLAKLWK